MFDPSISFNLDMMALEAGMTMFEIENGITDEYLHASYPSDMSEESAATEGASFMDGLFEDDFVATEGFKDTMGKVGKGIKVALITIGGAIKKIFVGLASKIKAFFQASMESFQRHKAKNDPFIAEISNNADVGKLRVSVNKVFMTVTTTVTGTSTLILQYVKKINKALTQAGIGNSGNAGKNITEDQLSDIARNVGDSFTSKNRSISAKPSDRNNNEAYSGLVHLDTEDNFETTITSLEKQNAELEKVISAINKMAETLGTGDKFKGEKTNSKGETKETYGERKMTPARVAMAVMQDINLAPINNVAKTITTQCSVHAKACDSIVKSANNVAGDNPYARHGYTLCKNYMRCAKVFSQISLACNKLFVFKLAAASDALKDKE